MYLVVYLMFLLYFLARLTKHYLLPCKTLQVYYFIIYELFKILSTGLPRYSQLLCS